MLSIRILGENIKKYREIKGLKQIDLAVARGFSSEYICRIERGQKYISLRKLFQLADILNIETEKLFIQD